MRVDQGNDLRKRRPSRRSGPDTEERGWFMAALPAHRGHTRPLFRALQVARTAAPLQRGWDEMSGKSGCGCPHSGSDR